MKESLHIPTLTVEQFRKQYFAQSERWSGLFKGEVSSFLVHKIEDFRHLIHFPLPPHRKMVHDFVFLTKGSMRRSKGLDNYEVEAGGVFFLPAYQITTNEYVSQDASGYYCHFDEQLFIGVSPGFDTIRTLPFLQVVGYPIVEIPAAAVAELSALMEKIEREYINGQKADFNLLIAYLQVFLLELKRLFSPAQPLPVQTAAQRITGQFKNALSTHACKKQSLSAYADLLHVSVNHLNKCVKKSTGRKASEWLEDMLLLESKVLLSGTNQSVAGVAFAIGMEDASYFGRFFKKKTGFTPTAYRKWIEKSGKRKVLS